MSNTVKPAAKFKTKKLITVPQLKLEKGAPQFFKIIEPMFLGKPDPKGRKEAPTIARVSLLETGEIFEIIVPAVLKSILSEAYGDDYIDVPLCVEKTTNADEGGVKYSKFSVSEVEL